MRETPGKDPIMHNPKVWVAFTIVSINMLFLFFRPTLYEMLGLIAIDCATYVLGCYLELKAYHHFYKRSRLYFPQPKPELFEVFDLQERLSIYRDMMLFPRNRAFFILYVSIIRSIPTCIYAYIVWGDAEHIGMFSVKIIAIATFNFSYMLGMCFLEYHNLATNYLRTIHQRCNWSEVFKMQEPIAPKSYFQRLEIVCAATIWIAWVTLLIVINLDPSISKTMAVAQIVFVSTAGLVLLTILLTTSRKQVMEGIENLIAYHHQSQEKINPYGVAISTNPVLAWYQKTLNLMIDRNTKSERETHRWILRRAEHNRYNDLGHLAGLVVHDLVTPISVMQHCLGSLSEQPSMDLATSEAYVEKLKFCLSQITEMVVNVRSSIRDRTHGLKSASPEVAHIAARKLVSYRFERTGLKKFKFNFDIPNSLWVMMPQPELNQVFLNLYTNAIQNMLTHAVESPYLSIEIMSETADDIVISFQDNGTGLSPSAFRFITEESGQISGKEGIGLKLTKRLVELYGGMLTLNEQKVSETGTQFLLSLRKRALEDEIEAPLGSPAFRPAPSQAEKMLS